jgi:hemoglobin-like flavoprotein
VAPAAADGTLASMPSTPPMTPSQIALVRQSWQLVERDREAVARGFYERLFAIAPELRPMFGGNLEAQGTKLMATLHVVVEHIDRLVPLLPTLRELAIRHLQWGVRAEHYEHIGAALMWTLEQAGPLGDDGRRAWAQAYTLLAAAMKEAAYPARPASPDTDSTCTSGETFPAGTPPRPK